MAGAPKGPLLHEIKPHIFFDDQVIILVGHSFSSNMLYRWLMSRVALSSDCLPHTFHGGSQMKKTEFDQFYKSQYMTYNYLLPTRLRNA